MAFEEFERAVDYVRNWGRWGPDDELGTLNYIDAGKLRQAASLVKQGKVFSLGVNLDRSLPWDGAATRSNPVHTMLFDGGDQDLGEIVGDWGGAKEHATVEMWRHHLHMTDDMVIMPLQAGTQWDALAHVYCDGLMYNQHPASAVTSLGATKNSIDQVGMRGGVVSRGVLIDVPRHRGVDYLWPHEGVMPDELDAVCRSQGVEVEPGDIVMVRTGHWPRLREVGGATWITEAPGMNWRVAMWLHDRKAAAIAVDNVRVEMPNVDTTDAPVLGMHWLCLREMGLMLGEIWDFEALAADCAEDKVYECQLVAPPLRVTGAVGSPLNPLALK